MWGLFLSWGAPHGGVAIGFDRGFFKKIVGCVWGGGGGASLPLLIMGNPEMRSSSKSFIFISMLLHDVKWGRA